MVGLFLQKQPTLVTTTTKDGNTSAHIAAKKGSVRVLEELLKFDKSIVTTNRNRITDSTPLHVATEGGHTDVVKLLLSCGASPLDENKSGMTPVHLAARFGHSAVISEFVKQNISLRNLSRKLGMTALHVAAFYGEEDIVRELMRHVPPSVKSEVRPHIVTLVVIVMITSDPDSPGPEPGERAVQRGWSDPATPGGLQRQ